MEKLNLLTTYIATWAWQLIAIIFLVTALIIFALPRSLISESLYVACFIIFIICEFVSFKKQKELKQ